MEKIRMQKPVLMMRVTLIVQIKKNNDWIMSWKDIERQFLNCSML